MADIVFTAQFVASKSGKDGIAVVWDIERVTRSTGARSALFTGEATNVVYGRRGLYGYRLTGADLTLYDYIATAITADATVDQKELAAMWTLWSLSWHDILTTALTAVGSIGKLLVDNINATILSRGTANAGDAMTLTAAYDLAKTAAQAGDAMALTGAERTTLSQTIWDQLLASMITPNSIGEFLATLNNFDPATQGVIVDNMLASALAAFFTINSGSTYAASIAGSVVKEIADNASGGGGGGSGAIEWIITIEDNLGTPIVGADVWATLGTTPDIDIVASGMTNVLGEVTFYLDAGTYYIWVQKAGINFSNPTAVAVV